jgi:hypothetical protein
MLCSSAWNAIKHKLIFFSTDVNTEHRLFWHRRNNWTSILEFVQNPQHRNFNLASLIFIVDRTAACSELVDYFSLSDRPSFQAFSTSLQVSFTDPATALIGDLCSLVDNLSSPSSSTSVETPDAQQPSLISSSGSETSSSQNKLDSRRSGALPRESQSTNPPRFGSTARASSSPEPKQQQQVTTATRAPSAPAKKSKRKLVSFKSPSSSATTMSQQRGGSVFANNHQPFGSAAAQSNNNNNSQGGGDNNQGNNQNNNSGNQNNNNDNIDSNVEVVSGLGTFLPDDGDFISHQTMSNGIKKNGAVGQSVTATFLYYPNNGNPFKIEWSGTLMFDSQSEPSVLWPTSNPYFREVWNIPPDAPIPAKMVAPQFFPAKDIHYTKVVFDPIGAFPGVSGAAQASDPQVRSRGLSTVQAAGGTNLPNSGSNNNNNNTNMNDDDNDWESLDRDSEDDVHHRRNRVAPTRQNNNNRVSRSHLSTATNLQMDNSNNNNNQLQLYNNNQNSNNGMNNNNVVEALTQAIQGLATTNINKSKTNAPQVLRRTTGHSCYGSANTAMEFLDLTYSLLSEKRLSGRAGARRAVYDELLVYFERDCGVNNVLKGVIGKLLFEGCVNFLTFSNAVDEDQLDEDQAVAFTQECANFDSKILLLNSNVAGWYNSDFKTDVFNSITTETSDTDFSKLSKKLTSNPNGAYKKNKINNNNRNPHPRPGGKGGVPRKKDPNEPCRSCKEAGYDRLFASCKLHNKKLQGSSGNASAAPRSL